MALSEDIQFVGQLLDAYATVAWQRSGAQDGGEGGVPPEMQVGEIDDEGYVDWRMLPSTLKEEDVAQCEAEFSIRFPPLFRAYLLARLQLFNQVGSRRFNQQIMMTDTPSPDPLKPIRQCLTAWRPLIDAELIPFADWGDGWGPMCFDARGRSPDGECPVVWLDHEPLIALGEDDSRKREKVEHLIQPLYSSCREFLLDVFNPIHEHAHGD